jgi:hypothetical protein
MQVEKNTNLVAHQNLEPTHSSSEQQNLKGYA